MTFVPAGAEEVLGEFPPLSHLSASSITQLLRCPEQFRQVKILGKRRPPAGAMLWGRADSHAIGTHFQQVADGKSGLTIAETKELFVVAFEEEISSEGGASEIEWDDNPTKEIAEIKDAGAQLVGLYREHVAPTVEPTGAEVSFEIMRPYWPLPLIGYCDVETGEAIIERKTTGRLESKPKGDWIVQGRIYQLAKEKPLAWHQSVRNRRKPEKQAAIGSVAGFGVPLSSATAAMTERLVWQAFETIAHHWTMYGPDNPWPGALTHPFACNYCGFRPQCAWWRT